MKKYEIKKRMIELGLSVEMLGKKLNDLGCKMSIKTLYNKINGARQFKETEIKSVATVLKVDVMDIFF